MSFPAIAWAMKTPAPNSAAKLLLIALADLVRPPAMKAWASAATLSDTTQLDRKTVLGNLKRLEEAGLILRTGEMGGRGGAPVFKLLMTEPIDGTTDTKYGTTSEAEPRKPKRATGTKSGIASSAKVDAQPVPDFPRTDTESGTTSTVSAALEPVPDFPATGTVFPANQYRISHEPVPKTGHEPVTSIEPVLNQEKKSARKDATPPTPPEHFFPDVDLETFTDWQAVRKAKKAGPVTSTVAKILRKQAAEAGITAQSAVEFCCFRAWQNFNADWYANAQQVGPIGAGKETFKERDTRLTAERVYEMSGGLMGRKPQAAPTAPTTRPVRDFTDINYTEGTPAWLPANPT